MRSISLIAGLLLPLLGQAAEPKPATMRIPKPTAWVGQRLPFFVDLRVPGSFEGAASFSLPRILKTVIVKVGDPVVSSEEVNGESWFVQTHEFALFSQQSGTIEIPAFEVRFEHHQGFTGPVMDKTAKVAATKVEIRRPPGSDDQGFLITTESIKIKQTWDPKPGPAKQGAVFHRTITQQAEQVTGMALAPPPNTVPVGIRGDPGRPVVSDQTERGDFTGKRSDTITYVLQESGTWKLPAITYVWWDPKKEKFGSQTFPEVTFEVAAAPTAAEAPPSESHRGLIVWIIVGLIVIGIVVWQHRRILLWSKNLWHRWNPPDRVAARKLIHACHRDDAKEAEAAWVQWCNAQPFDFKPEPELCTAVLDLQRALYGPNGQSSWQGKGLREAFDHQIAHKKRVLQNQAATLPDLN